MMKVRRKLDGHVLGGWAAEYKGHGTEQLVKKILHSDLEGMFQRSGLFQFLTCPSHVRSQCLNDMQGPQ
jgi:hypothetical protein